MLVAPVALLEGCAPVVAAAELLEQVSEMCLKLVKLNIWVPAAAVLLPACGDDCDEPTVPLTWIWCPTCACNCEVSPWSWYLVPDWSVKM